MDMSMGAMIQTFGDCVTRDDVMCQSLSKSVQRPQLPGIIDQGEDRQDEHCWVRRIQLLQELNLFENYV